jgi:AraC-like DNA-binding protein
MDSVQSAARIAYCSDTDTSEEALSGTARDQADMHEQWVDFVCRHVFACALSKSIPTTTDFLINSRCRSANGFTIARFSTVAGKARLIRNAAEIGDDMRDRYVVYMSMRGNLELAQRGDAQTLRPSTLVLLSASEPLTNTKLGDNDTIDFLMPRDFVEQRVPQGQSKGMRHIGTHEGLGQLVHYTLTGFQQSAGTLSVTDFHRTACLVGDLLLLAFSGCSDVMASPRSIRAANLARVKSVIRQHFSDPDLTPSDIAAMSRISLSYVHCLFRDEGRTLWETLKAERLQRARQMLSSPDGPRTTVTEVALACGFSNMSQFSTAFRSAFGMSPKDVLYRQ